MKVRVLETIDSNINDRDYFIGDILDVKEFDSFPRNYAYYYMTVNEFNEPYQVLDWIPKNMVEIIDEIELAKRALEKETNERSHPILTNMRWEFLK